MTYKVSQFIVQVQLQKSRRNFFIFHASVYVCGFIIFFFLRDSVESKGCECGVL